MKDFYRIKGLAGPFMKHHYRIVMILFMCAIVVSSYAQQRVLKGTIKDPQGETLPGVSVKLKGTNQGTMSNGNGEYSISVSGGNPTLVFTYVGFQSKEIPAGANQILNVTLEMGDNALSEVVVVGYGTRKKSDVTGAIASFKTKDLETMPQTNVGQALQGKVAGLSISTNEPSAEGGNNNIQIRGRRSITASNGPLIILDGIPYFNSFSEINPNDIESIDVLKDASSAAIYGARAANGVLIITTKRGKSGKPKITYDANYGIDEIASLPDMMDGPTFYKTKVDRINQAAISPTEQTSFDQGLTTDWVELATRTGSRQQHSLGVSGGTDDTRYYLSGTFNDANGIARNDDFSRTTLRLNLDSKISSWLTIGTNTQLASADRGGEPASFSNAFSMNPLVPAFNEDGSINIRPWPEDPFWANPLEALNVINNDVAKSVVSTNFVKIDFPFIKGLSYKANTGYTYRNNTIETYYGRNTKRGFEGKGEAFTSNDNTSDWLIEHIVNYNRKFGKHDLDFTGLYSAQERTKKIHALSAVGFPSDLQSFFQNGIATTAVGRDEYEKQANISQMARLNYTYNSKYLLTLTARRDGFSGFGANTKFGIFPSVALAWNLSGESFMEKYDWLDNLKLRASYGKNGQQAIAPYSTLPQLSPLHNLTTGKTPALGFYPNRLGDPSLGWETTLGFNGGLDFSFLSGRISGSVDYFRTNTSDLLLDKLISPVNGVKSIRQNIGKTSNQGIDFSVSSVNVRKTNFSWSTDLNISRAINRIDNVGLTDANGSYISDIGNRWFIGEPIDVNYGYVFDGIWQQNDLAEGSAQPQAKPGDVKLRDVSGPDGVPDGKISPEYDRVVLSSQIPSYIAGLTNTFSYKNFAFSFFIRSVQGVRKSNSLLNTYFDGRNGALNRQFWTPENPINTYPANRDDANPYGLLYFDNETTDASFIRLQDISLSYTLPANVLSKLKLERLQFFFNAKNVATFTKWDGLDPEFSTQTTRPQVKSYIFGLRTQF